MVLSDVDFDIGEKLGSVLHLVDKYGRLVDLQKHLRIVFHHLPLGQLVQRDVLSPDVFLLVQLLQHGGFACREPVSSTENLWTDAGKYPPVPCKYILLYQPFCRNRDVLNGSGMAGIPRLRLRGNIQNSPFERFIFQTHFGHIIFLS